MGRATTRLSRRCTIASDSESGVPGAVAAARVKAPSLKAGRNDWPKLVIAPIETRTPTVEAKSTVRGARRANPSEGRYSALSPRTTRESPPWSSEVVFWSSRLHIAGVTVTATTSEARRLATYAAPRGASSRPSRPLKKNNGKKTTTMIAVAYTMEPRISTDAAYTVSRRSGCSASGIAARSRNRR